MYDSMPRRTTPGGRTFTVGSGDGDHLPGRRRRTEKFRRNGPGVGLEPTVAGYPLTSQPKRPEPFLLDQTGSDALL